MVRMALHRGGQVERSRGTNVVTTSGLGAAAQFLAGETDAFAAEIGFGAGTTPATVADEDLEAALLWRPVDSVARLDATTVRVAWSLPRGLITEGSIAELGLRASDATLVARRVRQAPVPMAADVALEGVWDIHVVDGEE